MTLDPKDKLLKEALTDAKLVKEAALANAMLTLRENFQPRLEQLLVEHLREEDGDIAEQKKLDSSGIGSGLTVDEPAPKKPSSVANSSSKIDNPGIETDDMGDTSTLKSEALDGAAPSGDVPPMNAAPQQSDELDLEAIIRELEADLKQDDDMQLSAGAPAATDAPADVHVDIGSHDAPPAPAAPAPPAAPAAPAAALPPEEEKDEVRESTHGSDDEEVDLDEIMREIGAGPTVKEGASDIATQNAELRNQLSEHRQVVKLLRTRLQEVTLLNSKLMYTTKLFRGFNLSDSQKKRIIEHFNRTTTVREAKLVYSTLVESLSEPVVRSTTTAIKNISESASRAIESTRSKQNVVLTEGIDQTARFKKLAGIK